MEKVSVLKSRVIEKLIANRSQHRGIFEEACKGYQETAMTHIQKIVDQLKAGKLPEISIHLPLPVDHTRDYDRAIQMLEMSQDDVVELSEVDFASYIMDDWSWRRQFLASNSLYSARAARLSE